MPAPHAQRHRLTRRAPPGVSLLPSATFLSRRSFAFCACRRGAPARRDRRRCGPPRRADVSSGRRCGGLVRHLRACALRFKKADGAESCALRRLLRCAGGADARAAAHARTALAALLRGGRGGEAVLGRVGSGAALLRATAVEDAPASAALRRAAVDAALAPTAQAAPPDAADVSAAVDAVRSALATRFILTPDLSPFLGAGVAGGRCGAGRRAAEPLGVRLRRRRGSRWRRRRRRSTGSAARSVVPAAAARRRLPRHRGAAGCARSRVPPARHAARARRRRRRRPGLDAPRRAAGGSSHARADRRISCHVISCHVIVDGCAGAAA